MKRLRVWWFGACALTFFGGVVLSPFENSRDFVLSRHGATIAALYGLSLTVTILCTIALAALVGTEWRRFARDFRQLPKTDEDDPLRAAVAEAMRHRLFWVVIWAQTGTVVFNTLLPLTVLGDMPTSTALATFALLLWDDVVIVVPFRVWLYRLHRSRFVQPAGRHLI